MIGSWMGNGLRCTKTEDTAEEENLAHDLVHVLDPDPDGPGLIPGNDPDLVVNAQNPVPDLDLGSALDLGQFHEEDQGP